MVQIGTLLFLLLAPMAMGGMLLVAMAGRGNRESLSVPILAVFLLAGLAVSLFSLQTAPAHRGLILGLYLGALAGSFLASLLYLRGSSPKIFRGLLLVGGALGFMALVLQAIEMPRAHSVNLSGGRLALDGGLSAVLLGGLLVAGLLGWTGLDRSPLFKTAATWILTPAAIKAGLSGRYLWELVRLDLFPGGVPSFEGVDLLFWVREGSLLGLLIGAAMIWYSATWRSARLPAPVLGWTLLAGLLVELFGRLLLIQRGLLL